MVFFICLTVWWIGSLKRFSYVYRSGGRSYERLPWRKGAKGLVVLEEGYLGFGCPGGRLPRVWFFWKKRLWEVSCTGVRVPKVWLFWRKGVKCLSILEEGFGCTGGRNYERLVALEEGLWDFSYTPIQVRRKGTHKSYNFMGQCKQW